MIEFTEQQQHALDAQAEQPPCIRDPRSNETYVLLPLAVYERLKGLLSEAQTSDAYTAIDRAFAEGWDDPRMDDYDRYEELKQ